MEKVKKTSLEITKHGSRMIHKFKNGVTKTATKRSNEKRVSTEGFGARRQRNVKRECRPRERL